MALDQDLAYSSVNGLLITFLYGVEVARCGAIYSELVFVRRLDGQV